MPVINVKKDGVWQDIASTYKHAHTISDITDLPASFADDIESLKDKVGADSVAYQISTAIKTNEYIHPYTHPADMITGLSKVATSGDYNDLTNLPTVPSVDGLATEDYVDEAVANVKVDLTGYATEDYVDEAISRVSAGNGSSGGSSYVDNVQSDWEQTDSTKADYIKNKPFGKTENGIKQIEEKYLPILKHIPYEETDILPTVALGSFRYMAMYGAHGYDTDPNYSLTIGETYIVNWDGTSYECVAHDASAMMPGAIFIGNGSLAGLPDNNEPFAIGVINGQGIIYLANDDEAGNYHTVRIYQKTEESYTLKDEYQPDWEQIRNKPFGKTYTSETLIDGTYKYIYSESNDGVEGNGNWDMEQPIPITSDVHLVEGNTYTVTWDGTEYKCECYMFQGMIPCVGVNMLDMTGTEPFTIGEDATGALFGTPGFMYQIIDTSSFDYTLGEVSIDIKLTFDGLVTKKIDIEYLTQPNWNESDKSSAAYILNKPFGEINAGTVVAEGTAIAPDEQNYISIAPIGLIVGASYIVEFNGVSYTLTAKDNETGAALVVNTDEVFFGFVDVQGISMMICTQGEHTYKITLAENVVQKIDAKYLPDDIGGGSSLPEVTTNDNDKVMKVVDGVWSVAAITHPTELPTVSTSDAGKFLRVSSSGIWAVEAIPNAEGASF